MYWVIIIIVISITIFLIWASADVGSNIYLKTLCKGDKKEKVVSLTFDDGPNAEMTPKVLEILKENNISATFFLIGQEVEQNQELVRKIVEDGHIIGIHTYTHSAFFPMNSGDCVESELKRCSDAIFNVIGKRPQLFRLPFGVSNPIIGKMVRRLGYKSIGWSIRSLDTINWRSRESVYSGIIKQLHPGAVVLLHDRCNNSDKLLQQIILGIKEQGYKIISLTEMLNIDAYEN